MRELVIIQQRAASQNEYGEEEETWSTYAEVWASIQNNRRAVDLEQYMAGAGTERQHTTYVVCIYYDSAITVDNHRILWGTVPYDIEMVFDPDGRKQWTELRVREAGES